jgi:hypothetical protein
VSVGGSDLVKYVYTNAQAKDSSLAVCHAYVFKTVRTQCQPAVPRAVKLLRINVT